MAANRIASKVSVCILLVLIMAGPAMAADMYITVTAGPGDGTFVVSYDSTIAPRGVAFKVTVLGANITGSSAQNAVFNANIDYLYSNPGAGIGDGHALALDGGPGEFVPGPSTNVAVISAGVLDELGGQGAGPLSGDLITIATEYGAGWLYYCYGRGRYPSQ